MCNKNKNANCKTTWSGSQWKTECMEVMDIRREFKEVNGVCELIKHVWMQERQSAECVALMVEMAKEADTKI